MDFNPEEKINSAVTREIRGRTSYEIDDYEIPGEVKKKKDFYVEMVLILILGILVGIAVKAEALKRIAIGYDDYKMTISRQDYDINKFQADIIKEREEAIKEEDSSDQEDPVQENNK